MWGMGTVDTQQVNQTEETLIDAEKNETGTVTSVELALLMQAESRELAIRNHVLSSMGAL